MSFLPSIDVRVPARIIEVITHPVVLDAESITYSWVFKWELTHPQVFGLTQYGPI